MKISADSWRQQNHVNVPASSRIKSTYQAHCFNRARRRLCHAAVSWLAGFIRKRRGSGCFVLVIIEAGWPVSLGNDEVAAVLFWL